MSIILGLVLIAAVRWYYLKSKTRQAVRSILYLQRIAYGFDTVETNMIVLALESRTVDAAERETNVMLNQIYDGDRGVALMHARLEGFRG